MTTMTLLSRFCVIVLQSQVFNLIRALNVRSASYKLAGDNKSKRRSISTCGNIIRTNSTTILQILKRIIKIYSPLSLYISPLYPAKPIFSSLLCLDMLQNQLTLSMFIIQRIFQSKCPYLPLLSRNRQKKTLCCNAQVIFFKIF